MIGAVGVMFASSIKRKLDWTPGLDAIVIWSSIAYTRRLLEEKFLIAIS